MVCLVGTRNKGYAKSIRLGNTPLLLFTVMLGFKLQDFLENQRNYIDIYNSAYELQFSGPKRHRLWISS